MKQTNQYNYLTAKEREVLSYPAKYLLNKGLLIGDTLDFGCGFGKDVELLKTKGTNIVGYDKHYFPEYPTKKFDTIICFYVLNVLMQEEQAIVLMEISQLLKPTGRAYFAVRRDLQYEGFRTHKVHQKPTYQCNVILNYKSVFKNENCEVYEYKHFNQINKNVNADCPFCNPDSNVELLLESATAYAMFDKFPVSNGHTLIIPKKHCSDYFGLSFKEQSACWFMLNKTREILKKELNPNGFNVGININESAGQTIPHVHIHLIPRFKGDLNEPTDEVIGMLPSNRVTKNKAMNPKAERLIKSIKMLDEKIKNWDKTSSNQIFGTSTSERQDLIDEINRCKMRLANILTDNTSVGS